MALCPSCKSQNGKSVKETTFTKYRQGVPGEKELVTVKEYSCMCGTRFETRFITLLDEVNNELYMLRKRVKEFRLK